MRIHKIKTIQDLFGIDIRSLALFRIGLACLILLDLANRARDLRAHYTDWGVLPRGALLNLSWESWFFSFHLISGRAEFQIVLFCMAAMAACALLMGYRTRLATAVSWVLLVSLQTRNPMVLQGGDVLFRLLVFWAMFLPCGASLSVDRLLGPRTWEPPQKILSLASMSLLFQIALVYYMGSLLKTDSVWTEGKAVYYALSIDQFTTSWGYWLKAHPQIMAALSYATPILERVGPFVAFVPWCHAFFRGVVVVAFVTFHLGLGLTMALGLFPYICIVAWCVFIPSAFWEGCKDRSFSNVRSFFRVTEKPIRIKASWMENGLVVICFVYVVLWNIRTLDFDRYQRYFPERINGWGHALRLDQYWNMFAPKPLVDDGWYVIPAPCKDGQDIDLFRKGQELSWEKPLYVAKTYKNQRWRKYMMNLWLQENAEHRLHYGRYLCRRWNECRKKDQRVETFQIYYMREDTLPDFRESIPEKVLLWEHECYSHDSHHL